MKKKQKWYKKKYNNNIKKEIYVACLAESAILLFRCIASLTTFIVNSTE